MVASILALFTTYAPIILPIALKVLALLGAWLVPSPLQKAAKAPAEVSSDEKKADAGDPSGLDHP